MHGYKWPIHSEHARVELAALKTEVTAMTQRHAAALAERQSAHRAALAEAEQPLRATIAGMKEQQLSAQESAATAAAEAASVEQLKAADASAVDADHTGACTINRPCAQ